MQGERLQLKHLIEANNLQRIPWVARVLAALEHGMISEAMARNLLRAIEPLVRDAIDHPNFLHPAPEHAELYPSMAPDIEIGHLVDRPDVRFGLRLADRPRSILIAGNAGAGKTTAILNAVGGAEQLRQQDPSRRMSFIIADKKLDYTGLPDQFGANWIRVSVYDQCRIGLNAPDGVPPKAWVNIVASIFSARAGMIAAWTAFAAVLWWLLGVLNADPNHPTRWPSLQLVLDVLNAAPEKLFAAKSEYVGTLKTALQTAVQSVDTFDCFGGLDLERNVIQPGKSIVIEMPNVTPAWIRQLIQDLLIAQLIYGRIHRAQKNGNGAEAILVMDEADQDATLESDRRFPDQMSPLSLLLRMGREFGLMVIVGASRLNHLSPYVLLEPSYHLILNQSDAASILAARNTLLLPPGAEQMLPGLQPGMCIVRENGGPWPHPMLCQLDPPSQGGTRTTQPYDQHPFIEAKRLAELPEAQKPLHELIASIRTTRLKAAPVSSGALPQHSHALLHAAAVQPFAPVARLWEATGQVPSPEAQKVARKALEQRAFAAFEEIRCGRRNMLLIRIIDPGWEFLGRTPPSNQGRGGIAHTHLAHWIAAVGQARGYTTATEWIVPGTTHPVDAVWTIDGKHHAFECVVTCEGNLKDHIRACFADSSAVETFTIVLLQKAILDSVRKQLAADPESAPFLDHIRFDVAEFYLKELWK